MSRPIRTTLMLISDTRSSDSTLLPIADTNKNDEHNGISTSLIYKYNELGSLISKTNFSETQGYALDTVVGTKAQNGVSCEYKYDIRGWTTNIESQYFSQEMLYAPLYNGNISQINWVYIGIDARPCVSTYNYQYDNLNRILSANFRGEGDYSTSYSYDLSGNILNLTRNSEIGQIDNLTYHYDGNQLTYVDDIADGNHQNNSFTDNGAFLTGNSSPDYLYDSNGNLTKDQNKQITNITYNRMNLPISIDFYSYFGEDKNISYLYILYADLDWYKFCKNLSNQS